MEEGEFFLPLEPLLLQGKGSNGFEVLQEQ